jgi:hypothetical protein
MFDPSSWGTKDDAIDSVTSDEYLNGMKILSAYQGNMRGYMEDAAAFVGLDWFKDESKAAVVRGVFLGKEPLSPIKYRDSELTPESLKTINDNLQILLEQEKGVTADPNNLTPNQKRIKEYVDKLVYNKAKENAKFNLGFSPNSFIGDVINTTSDRFDFITNKSNAEAADLSDVIRIETEVDPSFNPSEWFDSMTKDPVVKAGLLQYGISDSLIAGAPNEDAAKLIIGRHLSKTDIQKRVSQYSPTWTDEVNLFATTMLNDPDLVPGIVLEAGVTALGAAAGTLIGGPVGTVAGGTAARGLLSTVGLGRSFVALKRVYDSSRLVRAGVYATETVAKLPLGMAPNYAKKLGLLGAVGSAGALGVVGGTLTETFRQRSELAYAAATLYSDPDAQKEYDYEAVAWAGLSSGLFGGALFGLAPSLIGAGFGATLNRLKGINLAKYGEPVLRDEFNKQWSLKGTLVGESLDSIKGVFKKEKTVIDGPVDEKLIAKAELTGEKPTGTEVVAETKERVDRAETRDIDSVEKATIVPEENAAKRYDNESKEQYINRVAPNRLITDIVSFARELSRSVPDALDNLKLSSFDWTKMTDKDKITVLNDAKTWINKAKEIESKAVGGLSLDRAKVYEVMEKQRRTYIRNLGKNMTKDEFKAFMKEVRGERRLALPAALEEARRTSATNKEKQEAASEVAAQLIERAKEISKDRDKSVRIREEVPAEVLKAFDSATTEASLTGKVSEETAETIRNNVMGIERPAKKFNMVRQAIDNALLKKRLDARRMEKIRAVVENPRKFVDVVEGNKEAALRFYQFVTQLKMKKLIAPEQQELLLAAVVHLNFDNRALNIRYDLGILEKNVVGKYDRKDNSITMNTAWQGDQTARAKTVLHELGHAFVSHKAKGELYLDMLKLYNDPIFKDGATFGNTVTTDSMLQMEFLREYHLSNVEETFVQTFAQILFKEGQIAVNTLSPIETSLLQKYLDIIAESLVLAADALNQSKYYKAANEVIDELVKVNKLLDDGVSVGRFVHKFTDAVTNASSAKEANAILKSGLQTDKYVILDDEWDLVSRMTETDPAFIVAYAIVKTQGKSLKSQADYDFLVNAYAAYKTAQFTSLVFRISLAMNVEKEFFKFKTKEQRIAFIENYYFDVVDTKEMGTAVNITPADLPTYEDRILKSLPSIETKDDYGRSYWLTTGTALRGELESRGINTDKFDTNAILSTSVFELTKRYLNAFGLDEIANTFANILMKRQIKRLTDDILNVEPSVDITNTPSFKKWFGKSKVVDKDGKPLVMYHGTDAEEDFSVFKKRAGMIFFSSDPEFASIYARVSGRVYPVYIKAENIFEAGNKNQIEQIRKTAKSLGLENDIETWLGMTLERFEEITKDANWIELEEWDIRRAIKLAGFDAMYVEEQGIKNIAVFDESQIKSIYNRGTFDPTDPDIRFNVEPSVNVVDTPAFKTWFGKSKVVDSDGKPLVMYHGSGQVFTVFKGTRIFIAGQGLVPKPFMAFFSTNPEFAANFALSKGKIITPTRQGDVISEGNTGSIYPVYIKAENPFDPTNSEHVKLLANTLFNDKELLLDIDFKTEKISELKEVIEGKGRNGWEFLELEQVRLLIEKLGFDAMFIEEKGTKNIAVFSPTQIKSVYNRGTFDPTNADIRFNVELPDWTNKDIATNAISEMLKSNLNLASVFQILPAQIEPNLLKTLIDVANKEGNTPEQSVTELLTGIYNAIDRGVVSYNTKTKKWETAQPKIKKKSTRKPKEVKAEVVKPKEPVKTAEETEVEAIADNSDVVTIDNYMEHLHGLMEKLSRDVESKGKNKGFISKSSEEAIVYIGKIMMGETPKLLASIESGSINTVAKLEAAIRKRGKNVVAEEGKEYRIITVTDPVTGKKTTKKVYVESVVSEEGRTKEGAVAGRMERIEEDGLERENKISFIENINKILQHIPDFITSSERELLDVFRLKPINVDAAKELNVSESTISRRYNTLLKKLNSLFTEAGIDAEVFKDPLLLKDQLDLWSKRNKDTVAAATKKKPTKSKVKKAEAEKPVKVDTDAEDKGKRMLELAAKTAKLKNEDPTPVPTPVTTTEPTMARVTAEVTGNAPEEVLRPEKQADAVIDGDTAAVKEVVAFTPKKPMSVAFNSIEELNGNPEKKAKLLALAPRMGFDAIVFKDGSVLPLKAEEAKVVGKTEINKPVGVETVVTVTKEKGVPVKKVTPAPKKPKAAPEGTPVVVKKTGEPKKTKPVQTTKSDVVKTEEAVRIERIANEQKEMARANGLDSSFLKRLLNVYWKAMKDIDKGTDVPYTPMFMKAWSKFIVINKELMDVNLKLVGEEGVAKFWAKVDELRAIEQVKKVTVPGYSARTDKAIFAEAAKSVDEKFIPFVTPGSLKIKVVNGDVVFTSKDPLVKAIVAENKTESPVPVPPTPKPNEKVEVVQLPEADDADVSEIESKLEEGIINAEGNASLPLRQSNLIGVIFGGDNREAINWWRALMNWMVNTTQTDSATGLTIRSMQHSIRFVSRMFDDTKAQTGHLAAAGKHAFRTAAQAKADEKRTIARLAKYQMRINKYLENMPDQRKALMLTIYRKLTEGAVLTDADVRAAGITDASMATTILKNSNELLGVVRQTNKTLLDLEAETGLVNTVDAMGNPVDPDKWATVQLDHEQLSRLSPEQRKALVGKLVAARTSRKLASSTLDINTLIVLGWLDVAPTAEARGTRLFAGDREYRPGIGVNTISKGSLDKLRTGITYPVGTDPGNILANLANKGMPDEFFVLKENGVLNVYRMPKVIDDLAEADVIRYREAVSGNTALYHPRWQTYLNRRNLIEAEMEEMLDFKTKSGAYSEFNSKTSSNIDRPLMRTGADEQVALAVPGLTPEEVLSFPEITGVIRTNIAEAYFYFLNGRMFALLFQRELDRLLGTKGITIINVFDWLVKYNERALKDLAKTQNWTDNVLNARIEEVRTGVSRLREEYAINADTLPYIPNNRLYSARAGLALMKMKVAPGYILSTMTEVMQELLKSNLIELPANLVNSIRYVFADIRSKKSKLLEEDIGDLPFILDNFKAEYGDRLLGEVSHGAFELDSKMKTKFIDSSKPLSALDRGVRSLETGARVAESIGSLQAVTNFIRSLAMTRWQRRIWTHISKQRIQKLLDVMENPDMRTLMDQMLEASLTNPVEERKLWKKFAAEARKAGFGFEPQEAMIFFRYGLNTKEKIKHLEYLIKNSGADSRGRVNINRMVNTYWQNKRNPQAGIDPRILEEVLSSYTYMLDDLIIRTSSPEPTGLGRITNIDSKTSFGKLWYALTSWIRGYQDSVVLNYASQSTLSFLGKSIILFGVLDTLTGLFREWAAGREHEDIVDEFTNSPSSFAVRVMKAAPIMGSANAFLEMFLSGLSALSGGSWRYYGSPMSSIGINAAGSATKDITTGVFDLAGQFTADDTEGAKVTKAIGDITSLNSLFNRSPVAVPARFIEDMGALDQKGAVQKYMDLIQREPYPYAKTQKKAKAGQATGTTVMPMERNIAQERAMFEEARKRQIKPEPVSVSTSNEGVSSILGNLLENE